MCYILHFWGEPERVPHTCVTSCIIGASLRVPHTCVTFCIFDSCMHNVHACVHMCDGGPGGTLGAHTTIAGATVSAPASTWPGFGSLFCTGP